MGGGAASNVARREWWRGDGGGAATEVCGVGGGCALEAVQHRRCSGVEGGSASAAVNSAEDRR